MTLPGPPSWEGTGTWSSTPGAWKRRSCSPSIVLDWHATLQGIAQGGETKANTTTVGNQETNANVQPRTVAMDRDSKLRGRLGRRWSRRQLRHLRSALQRDGVAQAASLVNSSTGTNQLDPAVAMDANGNWWRGPVSARTAAAAGSMRDASTLRAPLTGEFLRQHHHHEKPDVNR